MYNTLICMPLLLDVVISWELATIIVPYRDLKAKNVVSLDTLSVFSIKFFLGFPFPESPIFGCAGSHFLIVEE